MKPLFRSALVLGCCYFLLAWFGIYLSREAGNVAAIWPANALLLGVALRSPTEHVKYFVATSGLANVAANMGFGDSWLISAGFASCNMTEVVCAFAAMRWISPGRWRTFSSRRGIAFAGVAGFLAPLVGAALGALLVNRAYGSGYWQVFETWWLADAMGFLLITPAVLSWKSATHRDPTRKRTAERVSVMILTLLLTSYAFTQDNFPVLYIVTPVLMWSAFRFESFLTAISAVGICVIAVVATVHGEGPIPLISAGHELEWIQFLQLYLGVAVLVPVVVAALMEERQRLIGELEANNAELERYAFTVSHDLKSPLVTMQGFVRHLRADLDAGAHEAVSEDLAEIEVATKTMATMLEDLLELSKQGVVANATQPLRLRELIEQATTLLPNDATVVVDLPASVPATPGDRSRLAIVVRNILENSQKFARSDQPLVIKISCECRDGDVIYKFQDNGIGIAQAHVARVFDLFERLETDTTGSGVGLSIVKRIVEAHRGRVWIESAGHNLGTSVLIRLPQWQETVNIGEPSNERALLRTAS